MFQNGNNSRSRRFSNGKFQGGGRRGGSGGRGGSRGGGRSGGRYQKKTLDPALFTSKPVSTDPQDVVAEYVGAKYTELNIEPKLLANIRAKGYEVATEIQTKTIPMIREGRDVLGISKTGSGKTAAFLIPMMEKLINDNSQKLMVIAPTRELALQIAQEAQSLVKGFGVYPALVIGGDSIGKQISQVRRDDRLIIGTPGRIKDLIERNVIRPDKINNLVLDEVDRMLDMGFIGDTRLIFSLADKPRQALFFSATHDAKVERVVDELSNEFQIVKLSNNSPTTSVVQSVIDYTHLDEKFDLLKDILQRQEVEKAIIFVGTKRFADDVYKVLSQGRFKVEVIHGDKRQNVRKRVIEMFKDSRIDFLIATNVAARGIDIDDITHVINLDEPETYDEYIHRIGRTGRNGKTGVAYTFVRR